MVESNWKRVKGGKEMFTPPKHGDKDQNGKELPKHPQDDAKFTDVKGVEWTFAIQGFTIIVCRQ